MNQDEINLDSINYRGIIRDLLKNWWIIVLIVISLYLAATGIGKLVYIPEYTVSTTLVVNAQGTSDTYTSLAMANEMADIIKEVFQSDVLLELVENEIGKTNQGTITCNQIQETNLLVLNVTSKDPQLEDKEEIKERIKEATQYVALDQLCLSPQCGFSSTEEGNILTDDDQWKKMALIKEIAEEVWG